jgi:hypothetical protein
MWIMNFGNWSDEDCYYVSVIDGNKTALLLGPFKSKEMCEKYAYGEYRKKVVRVSCEIDSKAHFYSFGMVKMPNGHRE